MINWFDMPAEGLSNGGLFEVKELEVTENGTYEEKGEMYNKVTVNVEGGGGSWQTVFEGSVTTEAGQGGVSVSALNVNITADTIKATFNGTEYTCNRQTYDIFGATFNDDLGEFDFSEYPFAIAYDSGLKAWNLITPSSGTYTLKIEEPQSGGSSDFSTATLTVNGTLSPTGHNLLPTLLVDPDYGLAGAYGSTNGLSSPFTVILYKGKAYADLPQGTTSGGIVYDEDIEMYVITGDGTLTILG